MCGIAGYLGKQPISDQRIRKTLELMKNRGPDNRDFKTLHWNETCLHLLHSRLSIIDLDHRSNQPFTIGDCTIIFNGEIYNYVELRNDLETRGVTFFTTSDTEVLLQYYIHYGENCVEYFEGMWSFAIADNKRKILFLSRDRFAEKPLYYVKNDSGLFFGSEIKFLKALVDRSFSINERQICRYLGYGYKSLYKRKETFFNEVKELPFATNMIVTQEGELKTWSYWYPKYQVRPMTIEEAIEGIREHLLRSVEIRLRADVPLAFCLSGGIDSASLVSIAAKHFGCDVATFSIIEADERYNEYDNIMATVNDTGCKYNLLTIPKEESLPRLKELIEYHDIPVATITYYVHSLLSESIAKKGFKVAFSGTAADEFLTGYYDHFLLQLYELRHHPNYRTYLKDWEENINVFVRNPILKDPDLYVKNPNMRDHVFDNSIEFETYLNKDFREPFSENFFCDSLLRNRMMNELFFEATPVILHEDDLNSMKYSIENRSPYLDSKLFAFAYSIPPEHLIHDGYGKFLLREAVKGLLNDKVRLDRQKKGFNASISSIVDFKKQENLDYLLDEKSRIWEFLDKSKVESLIKQDFLPNHYSKFLFNFVNTKIFLELNA